MRYILIFFKGLIVGGTMLVPGVSGGSMAMILGIYDRLITAVSSFIKNKLANIVFLGIFALGGLVGMALFSRPVLEIMERFPVTVMYFFIGAVGGGIPFIFKKAELTKLNIQSLLYICLGFVIVALLSILPEGGIKYTGDSMLIGYVILLIAGFIAAIALVLPGISVSYMLLIMGLYHNVMEAVSELNIGYLLPLGAGGIMGIVTTTKVLEAAMNKKTQATFLIILGFVVGSVMEIFPGIPDANEMITSVAALLAGYGTVRLLSQV